MKYTDLWSFIEYKVKNQYSEAKKNYIDIVNFGNELISQEKEYNREAYNNAKKKLSFFSLLEEALERKEISETDFETYHDNFKLLVDNFFFQLLKQIRDKSDEPLPVYDLVSIPKTFRKIQIQFEKYSIFQKLKYPMPDLKEEEGESFKYEGNDKILEAYSVLSSIENWKDVSKKIDELNANYLIEK